jgi:Pvc16 N-terminal domain
MIKDVDSTLMALIKEEVERSVVVALEAPTREWAAKQPRPAVNLYLYDIREDMRRRYFGVVEGRDDGVVTSRRPPVRHFRLSYLITAWADRPADEHGLLADILHCFLRHDCLPGPLLVGRLREVLGPVPVGIALPPTEDRSFADVWSSLGGELKPSLDVVVVMPALVDRDSSLNGPAKRRDLSIRPIPDPAPPGRRSRIGTEPPTTSRGAGAPGRRRRRHDEEPRREG